MAKREEKLLDEILGDSEENGEESGFSDKESALLDKILEDDEPVKPPRKKKSAPEPESEPPKNNTLLRWVSVAAGAVLLIAAGLFFWYQIGNDSGNGGPIAWLMPKKSTHIMTMYGEKVSAEDVKLIMGLLETPDKDTALQILQEYMAVVHEAKARNLTLTSDEMDTLTGQVAEIRSHIDQSGYKMPDISDERIIEIFSAGPLISKMIEYLARDNPVDEELLQSDFIYYRDNCQYDYIDVYAKYVVAYSADEISLVLSMLQGGADVDEVIVEHSEYYDESYGVDSISVYELLQYEAISTEDANAVVSLEVGAYSPVITLSGQDAYAIFIVTEKTVPTNDELWESFRGMYIDDSNNRYFGDQLDIWVGNAGIELNQEIYDTLEMEYLEG